MINLNKDNPYYTYLKTVKDEINKTPFKDVFVIEPKVFGDQRGFFL